MKKVLLIFFASVSAYYSQARSIDTGNNGTTLSFIENRGQVTDQYGNGRKDIDYKLDAGSMAIFVGSGLLHYQWNKDQDAKAGDPKQPTESNLSQVSYCSMDVTLVGADMQIVPVAEQLQPFSEIYYTPNVTGDPVVHSYARIIYKNVYPHIDWVLYTGQDGKALKYDFRVHPGGRVSDIKLRYDGAQTLQLQNGNLVANTAYGSITENAPYSYDAATGNKMGSAFVLDGNILSYAVQQDNRSAELVIDPKLSWATYYLGTSPYDNPLGGVCSDPFGNVYMAGQTATTSNVATTGSYQGNYGGGALDGFLVKFNSAGQRLWATYYGGSYTDIFTQVHTDAAGNVYVAGASNSSGMATSGAFRTTLSSSTGPGNTLDHLLVKFNSSGARQWATYFPVTAYGGTNSPMTCDAQGNVYLAGSEDPSLATTGAFQTTAPSPAPGCSLTKFNTGGSRQWTTMFDGDVNVLTCDGIGNVYLGGKATSSTGIATTGTFQSTYLSAAVPFEGFLAKFSTSGTRLWGTYINYIWINDLACDAGNNLFVAGAAINITSNLTTTGAYQTSYGGDRYDGVVEKFSPNGSRIWGSYYGSTGQEQLFGIAIDQRGDVVVTGSTYGNMTAMATSDGYKTIGDSGQDIFVGILSNDGSRRLYGTYFGGNSSTGGAIDGFNMIDQPHYPNSITCSQNLIYFSCPTGSINIATSAAFQTTAGYSILAQLEPDTMLYIKQPLAVAAACAGDTLKIPFGVTKTFRSGNSFTAQLSNSTGSFSSPTTIATYSRTTDSVFGYVVPASITPGAGYRVRVISTAPVDTAYQQEDIYLGTTLSFTASANTPLCSGNTLNFTTSTITGATWSWAGPNSFTSTVSNPSITNAQTNNTGNYYVTASLNGCIKTDTVAVAVSQTPATPIASSNSPLCEGANLSLTGSSTTTGVTYEWTGPGSYKSTQSNSTINNAPASAAGNYILTAKLGSCNSSVTIPVVVNVGPKALIYPSPKDTICSGKSVTFTAIITPSGAGGNYTWLKNGNPVGGATNTSYTASGVNDQDEFTFAFSPNASYGCATAVNSNTIPITVLQYQQPNVTVAASDTANNWPGVLINFVATPVNAGNAPKYQWKLNNADVIGATSNIWGATTLKNGDSVCVVLTSSYICPDPATAKSCKAVRVATGVHDVALNDVKIYPNPTKESLAISGITAGTTATLNDVYGRTVYKNISTQDRLIITTAALPQGHYILLLVDKFGNKGSYKIVKD